MPDILSVLLGFLASLVIGLILIPLAIPLLRRLKFGQQILTVDGPTWHKSKQGTPTMGGLVFILSTVVSYLVFAFRYYRTGTVLGGVMAPTTVLTTLIFGVLFSLIGFSDDMTKIRNKRNLGLTAWQKILLQTVLCVLYIVYLHAHNGFSTAVMIPLFGVTWDLKFVYYLIAMLLIVGFVNAVNLTDGVDGLCTTVTLPVAAFFCVAAFAVKKYELSVLSACLLGGCVAYLIFNWHPAKIMMGDTGSMFLGAMVVGFAFALDLPLVILLVGIVYFLEALSVMIQVTYFKLTHGKRLFKMTPIHHSFELSGFSEVQICLLFGGTSLLACALVLVWFLMTQVA